MNLWGKSWSRGDLMARVGSLSQLGGITRFEYCDGRGKGVSALRVRTASGLEFTVVPDRGMDILEASYRGRSLCWHSPVGIAHPSYYDRRDIQWLRTFAGGLVTTCGLTAAGVPCEDGEELGLHGSISNIPAEQYSWREEWEGDELVLAVKGRVRESSVFGPNLLLKRTIQSSLGASSLELRDTVCNEGPETAPLMLLYHLNFGFPLVGDRSRIYSRSAQVEGRTELAAKHLESWSRFDAPACDTRELVYYHSMQADKNGNVTVVLVSDDDTRDFGLELMYPISVLPHCVEWKLSQVNHFVLGIEPANCRLEGRKKEREAGRLQVLAPGAEANFAFKLRVLDGAEAVAAAMVSVDR